MSELKALTDEEIDDWIEFWSREEVGDSYDELMQLCAQAKLANAPTPPQALMPEIKRYYMDGDGVAFESYDEHCPPGDWIRYTDFQSYILGATPGDVVEALAWMWENEKAMFSNDGSKHFKRHYEALKKAALAQAGQKRKTEGE